jgi:hypothetical protein
MVALHAGDIPSRCREGEHICRVRAGAGWQDRKPVPVDDVEETTR